MSLSEKRIFKANLEDAKLPDGNSEILREMDDFKRGYEKKEKRETAFFSLSLDKAYIDKEIEKAQHERDAELLQLFRRLPESLEFQPGKTLIVGENGSGKSTLAKALFLALKKERTAEDSRVNYKSHRRDVEEEVALFKKADQNAERLVYEPYVKNYQALWLKDAGLAPKLGQAFKVKDFTSGNPTGMEYADFHVIIGSMRASNERAFTDEAYGITRSSELMIKLASLPSMAGRFDVQMEEGDVPGVLNEIGESNRERGSARQTVEGKAAELIHGDYEKSGPGIYFLDEPESGISPMRHKKIESNIDDLVHVDQHPGSIVIIPTNSIKLYESDLPRIDLRYPERGIFCPSQFPDYFEN